MIKKRRFKINPARGENDKPPRRIRRAYSVVEYSPCDVNGEWVSLATLNVSSCASCNSSSQ